MNEFVKVICSEDGGFDVVGCSLVLEQNEDLWRAAKPLTQQCILGHQTLKSEGESSKSREQN